MKFPINSSCQYLSLLSLIGCSFLLGGCQSTLKETNNETIVSSVNSTNNSLVQESIVFADTSEINQLLLLDDGNDVIHPVADIEFSLNNTRKDKKANDINIWSRLRHQFTLPIPENKRLIAQRNWYVRNPSYLKRVAKRAEPFLHHIITELEKNDMPMEIALLPVVESAFDPFAYSHGRASGMWQFIPATGKRFGMKQNWWYDGRRDVIASTQGAINYLKYLHRYFDGDWLLALAAYNSGEGRVRRAVNKNKRLNKATDFWSLDLPKETEAYVPKLLALADIIQRPQNFDLTLYPIDNKSVLSLVDIKSQLDLAKAAELAGLSLAELQRLNPGFNRWATDPNGPHRLLLPKHTIDKFQQGLAKLTKKDRLAWQRYKIKNGDNLGTIAKNFNTRVNLIQAVNNIKNSQIRAGKFLLIPVAAKSLDNYVLSQQQRIEKKQNRPQTGQKITHVVQSGDNLWDLGQQYKVRGSQIAKWNGFAPKDALKLKQKLVIWQKKTVFQKVNTKNMSKNVIMRNIIYKVRRGDSFARIADKFNVSIRDIERWNKLKRAKYLQPGQRLKLSVDVTNNI